MKSYFSLDKICEIIQNHIIQYFFLKLEGIIILCVIYVPTIENVPSTKFVQNGSWINTGSA